MKLLIPVSVLQLSHSPLSSLSLAHTLHGDVGLNVFRRWANIFGTILGTHTLIVVFISASVPQAFRLLKFKQY